MVLPRGYPHVIGFHDFGIPLRPVQCREADGRILTHWVYTTMPRILPAMEKCAFFLYASSQEDKLGEPGGTGFFYTLIEGGLRHVYAISNAHVVEGHPHPRVRLGADQWCVLPVSKNRWVPAVSGDDIAAVDVTDDMENHAEQFSLFTVESHNLVRKKSISDLDIGIGDEVCMVGLYLDGRDGNYSDPVGRFGCLSALASESVLVQTTNKKCKPRPAHLIDMRSRDGFSGSPVFVYRTPVTNLKSIAESGDWDLRTEGNLFLGFLGVHYGQYPETVTAVTTDEAEAELEIASGMTTVVPAWELSALLEQEPFAQQRKQRIAMADKPKKTVKLEGKGSRRPAPEPNPNHREDFKRLLGAAAKRPKSSG